MNKDNMFKDGSALLAALSLVVIGMLCVMGIMTHLHNSLVEAVDSMFYASREEWAICNVERVGFEYDVVCWLSEADDE